MMDGMMSNNMMTMCMIASTLFALGIAAVVIIQAVLLAKILRELRRMNHRDAEKS